MAISSNASRLFPALVIVFFAINKSIYSKSSVDIYKRILGETPQNVRVIFGVLLFYIRLKRKYAV